MGGGDAKSPLFDKTTAMQRAAGYAAVGLAALAVLFVTDMMKGKNLSEGYLGGLDFKKLLFNYHPIFMTVGLVLFSFSAILSYRVLPLAKAITKPLHAFFHFCAISFVIMGMTCVLVGNNYPAYNSDGVYYANFFSLHSFIGLGAVLVFAQNYLLGFYHYLLPESTVSVEQRKGYMPYHVFFGFLATTLSVLAVETGLMKLTTESDVCSYEVTKADTNPAANYHKLPSGCKSGNAAGVLVMAATALFLFATYDFSRFQPRRANSADEGLLKSHHISYQT